MGTHFAAKAAFALVLIASANAADAPPPWAYGFKDPLPANWTPPAPAKSPAPAAAAPDPRLWRLPDSERQFPRADIPNHFAAADWFPGDHPSMPEIVAHGHAPTVWACARCHYPNGKGRPENAGIAGLPVEYFVEQLEAFRRGDRLSSDPRKPNTKMMGDYARAMTDEEIRAAAEYFAAMPWTPWIRVVESDRAPQTTVSAGMYLQVPGGADEALGNRIVEVPENPEAVEMTRNPRVGFVAYVPPGSVKRGEALVATGGGVTVACATCHGPGYRGQIMPGVGALPGLAGRSPSYLFRQLLDIKNGLRRGTRVELMKPVVANLSADDMLAIVAYLASCPPQETK